MDKTDISQDLPQEEKIYYSDNTKNYIENFSTSEEKISPHLIKAYLQVKKAAAETNYKCGLLFKEKYEPIDDAIKQLREEVKSNLLLGDQTIYKRIKVDAFQGGTGTYLNMNLNEVIANLALEISEKPLNDFGSIHPVEDVNLSQSTNDTFPTAVKIAVIHLLRELMTSFTRLEKSLRVKEKDFARILKLGRTQLQDAVPISLGQSFGAYADAIHRNIVSINSVEDKLHYVNLGGTAVGNTIATSREYVKNIIPMLQKTTGLELKQAENLIDNSQNLDVFVEVSSKLKSAAVNIIKIANDLRLLSSGPMGGFGEIKLPEKYLISSFIPGRSNPAVLENVIQISELIKGYDSIISNLVSGGTLELNSFLPMISHLLIKGIELQKKSNNVLAENCINLIVVNEEKCKENLLKTSAIAASLVNEYGFENVKEIVHFANENKIPFIKAVLQSKLMTEDELFRILSKELSMDL